MTTWAIIYNPTSGSFRQNRLEAVGDILRGQGIHATLLATERGGHATELARSVEGVDCILSHGGDGTLNEVANGMLGREVPLGFLPGGTANAMAFELGLPRNPVRAIHRLLEMRPEPVHPGMVGDRAFMLMAGFGFDAQAVYMVKGAVKARLGAMAYLAMGVRALFHPKPLLTVTLPDGGTSHGVWVVGSRGRRYGGMFFIHPRAALNAAELGVTVVSKAMIAPFAFTHLLLGHGWRGGGIAMPTAGEFHVVAQQPVPVHVDGDHLGHGTSFRVSQSAQAINFLFSPKNGRK